MSKSTYRENERLRKMQERIDAKEQALKLKNARRRAMDYINARAVYGESPAVLLRHAEECIWVTTGTSTLSADDLRLYSATPDASFQSFHIVLDVLQDLGLVSRVHPVDGLPEHMVIELADGGGWLYYGPDGGLRTLTKAQARHYLASEAERHVEEGVWA